MFNLPLTLAYLDPGTGAIVLQILIAAVLTTGVYFRKALLVPLYLLRACRPADPKTPAAEQSGN
jgi:hypothetical protein